MDPVAFRLVAESKFSRFTLSTDGDPRLFTVQPLSEMRRSICAVGVGAPAGWKPNTHLLSADSDTRRGTILVELRHLPLPRRYFKLRNRNA